MIRVTANKAIENIKKLNVELDKHMVTSEEATKNILRFFEVLKESRKVGDKNSTIRSS